MFRFLGVVGVLALVSVASAAPVTLYSNDFDATTGVTVRPNDPNNPTTGPYLEDGGVWAHVPIDSTGYQIMDVQMYDLQAAEVLDCTFGEFTITLQVEGEWLIDGEFQGIWIRLYSRKWDAGAGAYVFSGGRNFYVDVEHTSQLLGFGPGWQTFTVSIDDFNETDWLGTFDPTEVYKFRLDSINWTADITPYRFGITYFDFVAPECPNDLTGDDDVDLGDLAFLLSEYGCAPHPAINVWNVGGFEGYTLGALPGQDGWIDDTTDPNNYGTVDVINDPTGGGMGKVIELMADNPVTGGWLGAGREGVDLSADFIVLEWDQYRTGTQDNFWYADNVAWSGWWAMQWDSSGRISAQIYDFGPLVTAGQWQHVMYVFDTVNDLVTVVLDGEAYTSQQDPMTDDVINGIDFELEPTDAGGTGESVYVDNVTIGTVPDLKYLFGCTFAEGDYDGDADVDLADLAKLLSVYGCGVP